MTASRTSSGSSSTSSWARVAALAEVQGGNVSVWQARALGVSQDAVSRRVATEGWRRPHRAVLRMPGVPRSEDGDLWAALLAVADLSAPGRVEVADAGVGPTVAEVFNAIDGVVVATAYTAARRCGFREVAPERHQLLAAAPTIVRRDGIRLIRSRRGISGFWRWLDGMPTATPPRMTWDCAHVSARRPWAVDRLVDLLVFLDRTRQQPIDDLISLVDEPSGFGLPTVVPRALRAAAERLRPGFSHSATEDVARQIVRGVCAELGLQVHSRPYAIRDEAGHVVAEADVAVVSLKYDIEIDGPHHRAPSQRRRDRRRDQRAASLSWTVERFDVELVDTDPDLFRRRVRATLRRLMAELGVQAA